ncbi:MAG TPA: prepilin-type N-terminal cleavage/methylation domain-containing protein [Candidatus Binatia bacterium]|nr:prepilin-type N-terminal cleavage/methylation domain-containing protein [Candidatus Binatia bacterium]
MKKSGLPARNQQQAGFSLIEALIAVGIFAIAVLGLTMGATSVIRANQTSLVETTAANIAQDKLEELKSKTSANIISGGPTVQTVNGLSFSTSWTVTSGSPISGMKRIVVTVSWTDYQNRTLTISSAVKE